MVLSISMYFYMEQTLWDVIVVGAGLAGLTCAQTLHQQGYHVLVVEKSRGLGGRVATRRLHETCADHGLRYLEPVASSIQEDHTSGLVQQLLHQDVVQQWHTETYGVDAAGSWQLLAPTLPRYVAPGGMSAIAQPLAIGLDIWRQCRAIRLSPHPDHWQIHLEPGVAGMAASHPGEAITRAIVLTIPAPQAIPLLSPLAEQPGITTILEQLQAARYAPCLTVIAGYAPEQNTCLAAQFPNWGTIAYSHHPELAWIIWDSRKRVNSHQPVLVIHSTATYAYAHLDTDDLTLAAQTLLSQVCTQFPTLAPPIWWQVHRWRYAFPETALPETSLSSTTPLPIVLGGDWCGGNLLESAMRSGHACAETIQRLLAKE